MIIWAMIYYMFLLIKGDLECKPKISNKFLSCEVGKKVFYLTILGGGTLICE